jgi:hypothetical protein
MSDSENTQSTAETSAAPAPKRGRKPAAASEPVANVANVTNVTSTGPSASQLDQLLQQNKEQQALIERLMTALATGRNAAAEPAPAKTEEQLYPVENVMNVAVVVVVEDPVSGAKREIPLEKIGDKVDLTRTQIERLRERSKHFFDLGILSAPAVIDDTPNVVRDVRAFVNGQSLHEVTAAVEKITSVGTLYRIFDHIESQRFTHLDTNGQPLMEQNAEGTPTPTVRETDIDPKLLAIELAVQKRIGALQDVRIVMN